MLLNSVLEWEQVYGNSSGIILLIVQGEIFAKEYALDILLLLDIYGLS